MAARHPPGFLAVERLNLAFPVAVWGGASLWSGVALFPFFLLDPFRVPDEGRPAPISPASAVPLRRFFFRLYGCAVLLRLDQAVQQRLALNVDGPSSWAAGCAASAAGASPNRGA